MANKDLIRDIQTTSGLILGVIDTSRKSRPVGLRKPYEYVLPKAVADSGYKTIQSFLKDCGRDNSKFQYASIQKKGLTKGFKIRIFMLGYTKGLCGDATGITKQEWEAATNRVQEMLIDWLGPDALAYIQEFSDTDKFDSHFDAYIAYQEML